MVERDWFLVWLCEQDMWLLVPLGPSGSASAQTGRGSGGLQQRLFPRPAWRGCQRLNSQGPLGVGLGLCH